MRQKEKVIIFDQVTKSFDLNRDRLLKGKLGSFWGGIKRERFKAVKNVSFEVFKGESVGLWGENGSGKSTVLKLIGGLYRPDSGKVTVKGSVAPVLELGIGLHPDLSGSENIYFYSSILNISKDKVKRNFDEIVDFFGFENFLDVPVKRYSSGMKTRLAFSIAVFSDAQILLLDEILAVGDVDFKERALRMMREMRGKKTIVFTTHSYTTMQQLCNRMINLRNGEIHNFSSSPGVNFLRNLDEGVEFRAEACSGSMEPVIKKGDVMSIKKISYSKLKVGDIVAFLFSNLDQMVVHRVVAKRETLDGQIKCYTKGDFSYENDPWFLIEKDYVGKVIKIEKGRS
jgi:ABC-type polysaccharide/polyol phosphate transport system ATPase subunit